MCLHLSHTSFFQSEHGTSLVECRKRVALANHSRNTAVSFWETRDQLKDQAMIVDRRADISQLIREHLKTLTITRDIGKILHTSVREFLLKSDSPSVLVVLKYVSQMIPGFHSSGVWFQNDGQWRLWSISIEERWSQGRSTAQIQHYKYLLVWYCP